jgi:hypothetical protein
MQITFCNSKAEAQQVALPEEVHQECQKQWTRKPATTGFFSCKFSKAFQCAKKICSYATTVNINIRYVSAVFHL